MKTRSALFLALVGASILVVVYLRRPQPEAGPKAASLDVPNPARQSDSLTARPRSPGSAETILSNHAPEKAHPHPVTASHAAMAEQRALASAIKSALKARDVSRARQLLREHERRFPGGEGGAEEREGFETMASCIESPGAGSRARAERFTAQHRASPLRRKVRHICLGPRTPQLLR